MNANMTEQARPTMLTIRETARTGILPEYALRTLVKQGKIPGIQVGTKFLVNYDRLCDWLNQSCGTTHRVAEGKLCQSGREDA